MKSENDEKDGIIHVFPSRFNEVRHELTFNAEDSDVVPESPMLLSVRQK